MTTLATIHFIIDIGQSAHTISLSTRNSVSIVAHVILLACDYSSGRTKKEQKAVRSIPEDIYPAGCSLLLLCPDSI